MTPSPDSPGAPPVLPQFLVMGRSHPNEDHGMEQDGWSLLQRTIKIYLKVYLRVVVKLKTAACEGKGVGRRIRRAQSKHRRFSLPRPRRSAGSRRAVPHPHLTAVSVATLRTPTPIPEGNFGYL